MRLALPVLSLFFLTACQSGLQEGTLQSTFPPSGWETTTSKGRTQYLCNPPACSSTELVLVDNLEITGLSESLIRSGKVGPDVVAKVDDFIKRARKGAYQADPAVPVTTETYAGFRHRATLDDEGRIVHVAGQTIVQGSGGVIVLSLAHDRTTAKRNLDTYLSSTQIRRRT